MTKNKSITLSLLAIVISLVAIGCADDARRASFNLSKQGDMFELNRRVVFYNSITGDYMLTIEGRLSIKADGLDNQLEVTCKTGPSEFKKHTLGLSDNVTYFCEQLEASKVSVFYYRVLFKPASIVPDIDFVN